MHVINKWKKYHYSEEKVGHKSQYVNSKRDKNLLEQWIYPNFTMKEIKPRNTNDFFFFFDIF
jgi:hypothetical protein